MSDEHYEELCRQAKQLLDETHVPVDRVKEFCHRCEILIEDLRGAGMRAGRGAIMVELGLKGADVAQHPEKYRETSPKQAPLPKKEAGKPHPQTRWLLFHPESESYITVTSEAEFNMALNGEPLLVDVTGIEEHEKAFLKQRHKELGSPQPSSVWVDPDDEPW